MATVHHSFDVVSHFPPVHLSQKLSLSATFSSECFAISAGLQIFLATSHLLVGAFRMLNCPLFSRRFSSEKCPTLNSG